MARLLVKTAAAAKKTAITKERKYHTFRDYHTGEVLHYHKEHGDLECRIPVGGNVLSDTTKGPWMMPSKEVDDAN